MRGYIPMKRNVDHDQMVNRELAEYLREPQSISSIGHSGSSGHTKTVLISVSGGGWESCGLGVDRIQLLLEVSVRVSYEGR